jgi:hypothetical protein
VLLGVVDRIRLLQLLPKQGDFLTLRIVHDLRQSLSFTEEETVEFGLEVDAANERVRWNQQAMRDVEIPIGPRATSIIVTALTALDKKAELTEDQLTLYERFVNTEGE